MAMNATKVTLNVVGVNKTGKVFKQIAGGMASIGKSAALFSAAAVSGAAVAFAATAKALGHLSDVAMQAGTSTDELTKLSAAMDVLGIKTSAPEDLALAFQKMTQTVGLSGMGGFKAAIKAISELGTAQERSQAAMAVFSKAGLQFMPLIEAAAKDGGRAFDELLRGMPAVSQAAADAGDAVADAMSLMAKGTTTAWQNACGEIAGLIDSKFSGGVREAAMKANAYIEFFTASGMRYCVAWGEGWSKANGGISDGFAVACENMLKIGGNFVSAMFQSVGAPLRKVFEKVADAWVNLYIRITEGYDAAVAHANVMRQNEQTIKEMALEPWKNLAKDVRALDWLPSGTEVDFSDLRKKLDEQLAQAAKSAASVSGAAVGFAGTESAKDAADKIKTVMQQAKNEMVMGESYRAATMSIRADYGKNADKTVQAVNALKAVSEKIQAATEKTAAAWDNMGVTA